VSSTQSAERTRSGQLLGILSDYKAVLVVAHDNPDPDAIAAGWAILELVTEKLARPVDLVAGGGIVRAENRHMVELLGPPIRLVSRIDVPKDAATILVDCIPGNTNQALTREAVEPVAVIDHHRAARCSAAVRFCDIRPDVVASASIAASYLREQRIDPGPKLATALLYAMRTETCGQEFYYSRLDRSILKWATERAEPTLLAEIESAPLDSDYFADLALAIQKTFVYDGTALCLLPRAAGAEIVGEVADLLIRCRGIRRVLCGAVVGHDLFLSVRTQADGDNAVELLRATLEGMGSGGGHTHRAGGKIPDIGNGPTIADNIQRELRNRWLSACGVRRKQGRRLVAKREIVGNL
jgi:nanoRNase/pAp phosphatase (c-di-AMP/oligoRNAs hydrolase)